MSSAQKKFQQSFRTNFSGAIIFRFKIYRSKNILLEISKEVRPSSSGSPEVYRRWQTTRKWLVDSFE